MGRAATLLCCLLSLLGSSRGQGSTDVPSTTEQEPCNITWTAERYNRTVIQIMWFGHLPEDSNVTVGVTRESVGGSSTNETFPFSNGTAEFEAEYGERYRVNIGVQCLADEESWWIPACELHPNVTSRTNTSVYLTWDAANPLPGRLLQYLVAWGEPDTQDTTNDTWYDVSGLSPYMNYTFGVRAEFAGVAQCMWPQEVTVETNVGVPHAPTALSSTSVNSTTVGLAWAVPTPSTGPILDFRVRWEDPLGGMQEQDTGSANAVYEVDGLTPYVNYTFRVLGITDAGPGNWSDELEVQTRAGVPDAPTSLRVTFVSSTSVGLSWEAPRGPTREYRIRWKDPDGGLEERDTGSADSTYEVDGLTPYVNYTFRVLGITDAGPGNWSEKLEVQTSVEVPYAPTALNTTSVSNTSVGLTWEEPGTSTGPILEYRIRWEEPGGRGKEQNTSSANTTYEVDGLTPYLNYTFCVLAMTTAGSGNWSEKLEVQTGVGVPHAPTSLNATHLGNTTVGLAWEAPGISTGPILEFRVCWEDPRGRLQERDTGSDNATHEVDGLTPYVHYTFRVLGITEAGPGNWSEKLEVQTDVGVPHAPTSLKSRHVSNTTVGLVWEAPKTSTGPILEYRIRQEDPAGEGKELDTSSANTTYEVDGLIPYVNYTFRVLGITGAGPGYWSEKLHVRTSVGVPHAPVFLRTSSVLNTTVGLQWDVPGISTGPILRYRVHWRNSTREGETDTKDTRTYFTIEGLTPFERYAFKVQGISEAGPGVWSEAVEVQTDIGVPTVPRHFKIDSTKNVSLQLSWSRPEFPHAPAFGYVVSWGVAGAAQGAEISVTSDIAMETVRYTLTGLLPYTNYSVRVAAATGVGRGLATPPLVTRTDVGVPRPAVIRDVTLTTRRTVRVVWEPVGPFPGPCYFSLQSWRLPDPCSGRTSPVADEEVKGEVVFGDWGGPRPTSVSGLTPYAQYTFVVQLSVVEGEEVRSIKSDPVRLPPEAPSPPLRVKSSCGFSPTQAVVSWRPPDAPNGRIVGYTLHFDMEGGGTLIQKVEVEDPCKEQSHVTSGMRPERRYRVTVTASVEGVSEEGRPGRPRDICELPAGVPYLGNTSLLSAWSSAPHHVTLEWTPDAFSDYMGVIVRYSVLVGTEGSLGESGGGTSAEAAPSWANFSAGESEFYQATPIWWNPFRTGPDPLSCESSTLEDNRTVFRCIVGREESCPQNETFCNGPLRPDTTYELKIRGFTMGGFNETQPLYTRTGPLPRKGVGGTVAAVLVPLLFIGALVGVAYVTWKKGLVGPIVESLRSRLGPPKEAAAAPEPDSAQELHINTRPVPVRCFSEHVLRMMSDSHLQFSLEFEALKSTSPQLPCTMAESEENRPKNRWMNIFPFDHSRVKLLPLCDEPGSDFINASYVPGPSSPREYIATQGPLPHTVDDFWRMAWEQAATTIVMLTQCVERGKRKCERYWPDAGEAVHYGDLAVATLSESMLARYVIRVFRLQLGSYERRVKQMHFTHWPDFGCPDRPEDLLEFVRAVREHMPRADPGPILVHCSAGVGRTGTFIVVDRLAAQLRSASLQSDDTVDVYGTVLELRRHRTNMVQTEDQYIYIHLCVPQLIWDRGGTRTSEENVYSNVGSELDTPF